MLGVVGRIRSWIRRRVLGRRGGAGMGMWSGDGWVNVRRDDGDARACEDGMDLMLGAREGNRDWESGKESERGEKGFR